MNRIDIIQSASNRYLIGKTDKYGTFYQWAEATTLSGAWAEARRHAEASGLPIDPVSNAVKQELIEHGFLEDSA